MLVPPRKLCTDDEKIARNLWENVRQICTHVAHL